LLHFASDAIGAIENPRHFRKGESAKLANAPASPSARKKRGLSHRRKKTVQRVGGASRKARNQCADFLHKQSRKLVNTYGFDCV